jgi:hypothetical protein
MQRKVIDTNFLQDKDLRRYLSETRKNLAVIPDYVAMEIYKAASKQQLADQMSILSAYPEQVVILKNTYVACQQSPDPVRLHRRLIDRKQTREFPDFCRAVRELVRGNAAAQRDFEEHKAAANEHLDFVRDEMEDLHFTIEEIRDTYGPDDLKSFRENGLLSDSLVKKFMFLVMRTSKLMFEETLAIEMPNWKLLPNTYICRYSVCCHYLALKAAAAGKIGTNPERWRNRVVDSSIAAYATFFHGVLSRDKEVLENHRQTRIFLDAIKAKIN